MRKDKLFKKVTAIMLAAAMVMSAAGAEIRILLRQGEKHSRQEQKVRREERKAHRRQRGY